MANSEQRFFKCKVTRWEMNVQLSSTKSSQSSSMQSPWGNKVPVQGEYVFLFEAWLLTGLLVLWWGLGGVLGRRWASAPGVDIQAGLQGAAGVFNRGSVPGTTCHCVA